MRVSESKTFNDIRHISGLGDTNQVSRPIPCNFQTQEPMDGAKVLHLEGTFQLILLLVQQVDIVRENHEIIHIEGYDTKLLVWTFVDKDAVIRITSGKAKLSKFFFCLLIPCPRCLFQTIKAPFEFPDNTVSTIIRAPRGWLHVDSMFEVTI